MTGDNNCKFSREMANNSINYYNSDDELTGYRNAMTSQQLQMYRFEKQQKQQAWDSINQSIKSIGD